MLRIFKVKELEEKRRALAAESEVYRQTLTLEIQNLRLHAAHTKRRFSSLTTPNPLIMMILPFAKSFLVRSIVRRTKNRFGLLRVAAGALFGWKVYRKFAPLLRDLLARYGRSRSSIRTKVQEQTPRASY
jgi:hypothetical protein